MAVAPASASDRSDLFEAIPDTIKRFNHVERSIDRFELSAQSFDVTVDSPVVNIYLIVIGRVHERVAALHDARTAGERLEHQKLGDGQLARLAVPRRDVTLGIHAQ